MRWRAEYIRHPRVGQGGQGKKKGVSLRRHEHSQTALCGSASLREKPFSQGEFRNRLVLAQSRKSAKRGFKDKAMAEK
jgi:hypothetical protein